MKKFIFILFALAGMAGTVSAQTLTVSDVYAKQGETVVATLNYACPADTYTGMKITLQFPSAGFTVAEQITEEGQEYTAIEGSIKNIEYSLGDGYVTYTAASSGAFSSATINVEFTVGSDVALSETGYEVMVSGQLEGPNSAKAAINGSFKVFVNDYVTLDENSQTAPKHNTTSEQIKVLRTLKKDEWSTICFPFLLTTTQLNDIFGEGYEIATISGCEVEKDGDKITGLNVKFTKLASSERTVAGTPYIVKATKDVTDFTYKKSIDTNTPTVKSISEFDEDIEEDVFIASMTGTYVAQTVVPKNSLFLSDNKFWYSVGLTKMKAFRAYFTFGQILSSVEAASSRIKFFVSDGDTQTEIQIPELMPMDGEYYDLKGQRVETPSKGIYIKDGKKVVVK